jgi:hypothetical protein
MRVCLLDTCKHSASCNSGNQIALRFHYIEDPAEDAMIRDDLEIVEAFGEQ